MKQMFPESRFAHHWLDGLSGLEIGPSTHNPFGLNTRNVGLGGEGYTEEQLALTGAAREFLLHDAETNLPNSLKPRRRGRVTHSRAQQGDSYATQRNFNGARARGACGLRRGQWRGTR